MVSLEQLPDELLVQFFYELDPVSTARLCRTNSNLSRFCSDPQVRLSTLFKVYSTYSEEKLLELYRSLLPTDQLLDQERLGVIVRLKPEWLQSIPVNGSQLSPCVEASLIHTQWLLKLGGSVKPQDLKSIINSKFSPKDKALLILTTQENMSLSSPLGNMAILDEENSEGGVIVPLDIFEALVKHGLSPASEVGETYLAVAIAGNKPMTEAWMELSLTAANPEPEYYEASFLSIIYNPGGLTLALFNLLLTLGVNPESFLELSEFVEEEIEGLPEEEERAEKLALVRHMQDMVQRHDFVWTLEDAAYPLHYQYHLGHRYTDSQWSSFLNSYTSAQGDVELFGLPEGLSPYQQYLYCLTNPLLFFEHRGKRYGVILPYEMGRGFLVASAMLALQPTFEALLSGQLLSSTFESLLPLYGFERWDEDIIISLPDTIYKPVQTKKYRLIFSPPYNEKSYVLQYQDPSYVEGMRFALWIVWGNDGSKYLQMQ